MRLLMLKLLMIVVILGNIFANELDKKIIKFEKQRILRNPTIKLLDIKIYYKQKIMGWNAYVVNLKLKLLRQGNKEIDFKDILFSDGKVIATEMFNINGVDLKRLVSPKLSNKYYNKEHLIAGNLNAKNKIVLFSDPLCPFCINAAPKTIKKIKKRNDIALFYYHFPLLSLHPASDVISRYMVVAHKKGVKDLVLRIYEAKLDEKLDIYKNDPKIILPILNKIFNTNITEKDINQKWVKKEVLDDIKMGEDVLVRGTPTIFVNGVKDSGRTKMKKLLGD